MSEELLSVWNDDAETDFWWDDFLQPINEMK